MLEQTEVEIKLVCPVSFCGIPVTEVVYENNPQLPDLLMEAGKLLDCSNEDYDHYSKGLRVKKYRGVPILPIIE